VAAGTRITWTNTDDIPHSVTADDKRFDSGPIQPGKTFAWTADAAGTLAYHCIFHPSMMAQLTVTP
jgi:plastocyanin